MKHFSNWGIQLMPVKIKNFSILDMELYEFVWKFCEKQLRRGKRGSYSNFTWIFS